MDQYLLYFINFSRKCFDVFTVCLTGISHVTWLAWNFQCSLCLCLPPALWAWTMNLISDLLGIFHVNQSFERASIQRVLRSKTFWATPNIYSMSQQMVTLLLDHIPMITYFFWECKNLAYILLASVHYAFPFTFAYVHEFQNTWVHFILKSMNGGV